MQNKERKEGMRAKMIVVIVLLVLVLLFILQNTEEVRISLLIWSFAASKALMTFVLLLIGFVTGWLLHGLRSKKGSAPE